MQSRLTKSSPNIRAKLGNKQTSVHVFHLFYPEQCKRLHQKHIDNLRDPGFPETQNDNTLLIVCDKITPEEWVPILNALRFDTSLTSITIRSRVQYKFLRDIDNEDKARRMKRRTGSLFTTYIMKILLLSLSSCLEHNKQLSSLQLECVPISIENIDPLLEALRKNTTIKNLGIKYCALRDLGFQFLCNALYESSSIEILNLTSCGLGAPSAQYLADLLKFHKTNTKETNGFNKIILNNNPNIGDEGLFYLLEDLSVKALDMQRCGITENISPLLIDRIASNQYLRFADFRYNENLSMETLVEISEILKEIPCNENDYRWRSTSIATNLHGISNYENPATEISPAIIKPRNNLNRTKTCTSINNMEKYSIKNDSHWKSTSMATNLQENEHFEETEFLGNRKGTLNRMKTCPSINNRVKFYKESNSYQENLYEDSNFENIQGSPDLKKSTINLARTKTCSYIKRNAKFCNDTDHYQKTTSVGSRFEKQSIQNNPAKIKSTVGLQRMKTCSSLNNKPKFCIENYYQTANRICSPENSNFEKNRKSKHVQFKSSNASNNKNIYPSLTSNQIDEQHLLLKQEIEKERAIRIQNELQNKKLREELAQIKSSISVAKVIKYNPLPVSEVKIKIKPKPEKKPPKVEFIFENNQNKIAEVLKSILSNTKCNEDEIYYRSLLKVTKEDDKKEDLNGSNSSLIKYMRGIKKEIALKDNMK